MSNRNAEPMKAGLSNPLTAEAHATLTEAARDRKPVSGWTHNFYRYPARFSPSFAAAAIECFSKPGDLIADPYMGGGTTVVEGMAAGRHVVGNDLNSLAAFITKAKITPLHRDEVTAIREWAANEIPRFTYRVPVDNVSTFIDQGKVRNLSLVRARFIKKAIAAALASISNLPTGNAQDFARCAVLRASQWALDGRSRHTTLADFRNKLARTVSEMIEGLAFFANTVKRSGGTATLLNVDATDLIGQSVLRDRPVNLVVTSPPYPGVHVLYHRWQVDGRRETPAPYWIAGCTDGQGASYYNFGDRRQAAADNYFRKSVETLRSIRGVMRDGAYMVQMVAFNKAEEQLPRYLENMENTGFVEVPFRDGRIWRQVPQRKWHATYRGQTEAANEVVLIHRAR
jgi:DNA modification methylase